MYYIYEKASTYIIGKPDRNGIARPDHRQSYKTLGAAKAALTRLSKSSRTSTPIVMTLQLVRSFTKT